MTSPAFNFRLWNEQGLAPAYPVEPIHDEARHSAVVLVRAIAESLDGHRPTQQFSKWLTVKSWQQMQRFVGRHRHHRVRVSSMRLRAISSTTIDVYARYTAGSETLVATMRVSSAHGWRCESLSFVWPPERL